MKKKVIFACSSGGHLNEILRLEPLFKEYDYLLVTEHTKVTESLKEKYNIQYLKYGSIFYFFSYIFIFLYNLFKGIKIVAKFRPDTVVSTGAHTGGLICYIAKVFGSKIIYIETLAKTKSLSKTGENVYKIADKFYVQWESLKEKYPKAEYIGRLM